MLPLTLSRDHISDPCGLFSTPIFSHPRGYLCEPCDIFFRNLGSLNRHRETQHIGLAHDCGECGKKFTSSSYLATHKKEACEGKPTVKVEALEILEELDSNELNLSLLHLLH